MEFRCLFEFMSW